MEVLPPLAVGGRVRPARRQWMLFALGAGALLSACSALPTWLPSWMTLPTPSFSWFSHGSKLGPLPEYQAKATPRLRWQVAVGGKVGGGFAPAVRPDVVYAAGEDGTLVSVDPASGAQRWRVNAGMPLSAGVRAGADLVVGGAGRGGGLA